MSAAFGDAPEPVNAERFNTRNGVVRVGEIGPAFQHNALVVDGKRIFVGPSDGILLWHDYRVGTADAVLFDTGCSGSSCGDPDRYYFALLRRGKHPVIISDPDFYSADGRIDPRPATAQGAVVIELGFEKGLRKWAELKGSRVTIHHESSDARISVEACKQVHSMALDDCSKTYVPDRKCDFGLPVGSVADMGNLRSLSNAPGFDSAALGAACHAQCSTGVRSSFDTFSKEVCGIK